MCIEIGLAFCPIQIVRFSCFDNLVVARGGVCGEFDVSGVDLMSFVQCAFLPSRARVFVRSFVSRVSVLPFSLRFFLSRLFCLRIRWN